LPVRWSVYSLTGLDEPDLAELLRQAPGLVKVETCTAGDLRPGREAERWLNTLLGRGLGYLVALGAQSARRCVTPLERCHEKVASSVGREMLSVTMRLATPCLRLAGLSGP